jgi:hypothetical protein
LDRTLDVVQSNKAFRTGSNSEERLFRKVEFDGPIKNGYNYTIIDDVVTQGGTVRSLREYIESNGGKVVAVAALTTGQGKTAQLAITDGTLKKIKERFGHERINTTIKEIGISDGIEWLTEYEGRQLLKFQSVDSFRNRGLEGGLAGSGQDTRRVVQKEPHKINKESSNVAKSPDKSCDFSIPGTCAPMKT